jgi:hypothetical protein
LPSAPRRRKPRFSGVTRPGSRTRIRLAGHGRRRARRRSSPGPQSAFPGA